MMTEQQDTIEPGAETASMMTARAYARLREAVKEAL